MVAVVDLIRGFKMIVGKRKREEGCCSECAFCRYTESINICLLGNKLAASSVLSIRTLFAT